ncbi:MAG: peptidylprolyl isomerase [Planctomycetota bacterium]|jgi:cyclophilin family peptidyl-prolyl cis-trans isomerase
MAERPRSPDIPLPDPDAVQRTYTALAESVRARPRLYTGLGTAALLVAVGIIFVLSQDRTEETSAFAPLWARCESVRAKLRINKSAARELVELEGYLEKIRGTRQEANALWLLAIYHYREAWTEDKAGFEERRPHLERALGYLEELRSARFEERDPLIDKPRWFVAATSSPVDKLHRQIKKDLDWSQANSYAEPQPGSEVVAVLRTSAGDVHLQFFDDLAPKLTENFVSLARAGTYNGTAFHFVRKDSAGEPKGVMGGDPFSFFYNDPLKKKHLMRWGQGGVGYDLPPEESSFRVNHRAGIVTSQMRERADWNNGVQFMIMIGTDPTLDRKHTPFGKVVEGLAVIEKAAGRRTAVEHPTYKDDYSFSGIATRDLVVDPVIVHKVIVFENGQATEHAFPLANHEKALATLASAKVEPLPEDAIYCGRLLRQREAEGRPRLGLDIPFPDDVDAREADPKGDRKPG